LQLLWSAGIPCLSTLLVWLNRASFYKDEVRQSFGCLNNGYENSFWYWDGIMIIRKVILFFLEDERKAPSTGGAAPFGPQRFHVFLYA
jgi:hypothetical protein